MVSLSRLLSAAVSLPELTENNLPFSGVASQLRGLFYSEFLFTGGENTLQHLKQKRLPEGSLKK
jgi:hypothetical protein